MHPTLSKPIGFVFLCLLALFPITPCAGQEHPSPDFESLADQAIKHGNPARGAVLYSAPTSACLSCHRVGEHGGRVGPDLSEVGKQSKPALIVESLFFPKKVVAKEYQAVAVLKDDGSVIQGYMVSESDDFVELRDTATNRIQKIPQDEIEGIKEVGTLMPDGLMANLSEQDRLDLISFLLELGTHKRVSASSIAPLLDHAHGHHAATFEMPRKPITPDRFPSWQEHVNRDRVYDFYAKQARHFRDLSPRPLLLAEYPGLDGGTLGHWGNQSDADWADGRWNDTDLGSTLAGVFRGPGLAVGRAICVRLDEKHSACFDPDKLSFVRVWSGGFVKFTNVRRGFMQGINQDGPTVNIDKARLGPVISPKPNQDRTFLGWYRHGRRVIFSYRIDGVEYLDSAKIVNGKFEREIGQRATHPDRERCSGGAPQWPQVFSLQGTLGESKPYACDKIPLPTQNPWDALLYGSGIDFLSDGSAIYATMQGDIWKVNGLDETLNEVRWRRIASGLHQPLGVVVHDDEIFVIGRDQLTRLHDLNDDGEIDFYECYSNAVATSRGGHDFTCGLVRDPEGCFYTATGKQGVMKISPDGRHARSIAGGLRNSDGIGIYPDGLVTVPSSEGDWMPASMIAAVHPERTLNRLPGKIKENRAMPFFGRPGGDLLNPPDLPMVYLPRGLDNSSGGQVFATDERWGPLAGQMVHLSYGAGTAFALLRDEVNDWVQGAVVPLGVEFASGAHRGAFSPADGQLYVAGMGGWGTYTTDDGCLHRVRFTKSNGPVPVGFHVHRNGLLVRFSEPLNASVVENPSLHFAQAWNYRYSGAYGSPEFSTRRLGLRGHDVLAITSACVVDENALFLEIPDLQPANQLHLLIQTEADQEQDLFLTVHQLAEDFTDYRAYQKREKAVLPHPMTVDFYRPKTLKRNPFRKAIQGARDIKISAAKNLMFDINQLEAKPGEAIRLTFENPDAVPHNWALLNPGTLQSIGAKCNQLIADVNAASSHYIPESDDVLAYVDVVEPNGKFTIYFRVPEKPGVYPYLCTFPGHWMVMNGQLIVK